MLNEEKYHSNLEIWAHSHPKEAIWLQYFDCKSLEICETEAELLNLRKKIEGGDEYFYEEKNPLDEALNWKATLDLENIEVLYIYGVGLGYYLDSLKDWLKADSDHHIVFLEDDLEVIAKLFETEKGTQILSNPQVNLYFFSGVSETEVIFNQLFWKFPMAKLGFGALKYYRKTKGKKYEELQHQISYDAGVKNSLLEEYLQYGIAFYRNYYANILHLNEAFLGNALFGQFDNVPAIICGAGPSLQKNISLLKKLGDKAIIFAGSSALNALAAEDIQPHLGAGIDPNPMQEERLKHIANLNFPFLYRNRMYPGALKLVTGPKLYLTGSGGYQIAEFFESKFDIEGEDVEEGRNVVNFCLEVAHEMGCNPIIFVGMDLAYTEMKEYTEGVVENPSITKEDLSGIEDFNETAIPRKDIFGNDLYTLWKWVSEAKWIGDFAENHPEIMIVNATEGGLGFPGVPNKTLENISKEFLSEEYDLKSKIKSIYTSHPLSYISKEKILTAVNELKKGLHYCLETLSTLDEENEKIKAEIKRVNKVEHTQTGKAALLETELSAEPAFVFVLQIFNEVSSRLMQRDVMKLLDPNNKASEVEKELEKLNLNSEKYKYLATVARVNLELLNYALEQESKDSIN